MFSDALYEFTLLFLVSRLAAAAAATCYFPDGSVATGNVPCGDGNASCCGSLSACLANGLCLVNNNPNTIEFARGACTDPTWSSPNCFQKCITTSSGTPMTNGAAVFECDTTGYASSADYCCEKVAYGKDSCCSTPALRFTLGAGTPAGKQNYDGNPGSQVQQQQPIASPSIQTTAAVPVTEPKTTVQTQTTVVTSVQTQSAQPPTSKSDKGQASTKAEVGNESSSSTSNTYIASKSSLSSDSISSKERSSDLAAATTGPSTSANLQEAISASSSADAAASQTDSKDSIKIAVGVAVPVAVLLAALLGFLVWNNHRNQKKIRSLHAELDGRGSLSSMSPVTGSGPMIIPPNHVAELNNEKSGVSVAAVPTYPHHEYYKTDSHARRPMHELSGDSRAHEISAESRHVELDSTPTRTY